MTERDSNRAGRHASKRKDLQCHNMPKYKSREGWDRASLTATGNLSKSPASV